MELTHDDVVSILELLERSNVEYLEVEVGGTRIVADRSGATTQARGAAPVVAGPAAPAAPAAAPAPPAAVITPTAPVPPLPSPTAATETRGDAELVTVTAPMLGVFFRAPQPGAPAFVEIGSYVEEGATLGLVEVMKMFNGVAAPIAGEVVEMLVSNEEFVEYGQPLFRLRPAAA